MMAEARPCVLVFAGLDPSGGAGLTADVQAVAAQGAHALAVATALTVQDNDRVFGVQPVDSAMVLRQARALIGKIAVSAVKIGITGSAANARAVADLICELRVRQPALPVVLDPVLASGHGDLLSRDDAVLALSPLLPLATVITPNGPEAQALTGVTQPRAQAQALHARGCRQVLITGGHGTGYNVINRWFAQGAAAGAADAAARAAVDEVAGDAGTIAAGTAAEATGAAAAPGQDAGHATAGAHAASPRDWRWPRLAGEFHGSGCTLAAAIAGQLALGRDTASALENAQQYVYHALRDAYVIASGQRIPLR